MKFVPWLQEKLSKTYKNWFELYIETYYLIIKFVRTAMVLTPEISDMDLIRKNSNIFDFQIFVSIVYSVNGALKRYICMYILTDKP
jgi:hypothetical protein